MSLLTTLEKPVVEEKQEICAIFHVVKLCLFPQPPTALENCFDLLLRVSCESLAAECVECASVHLLWLRDLARSSVPSESTPVVISCQP